MPDLSDQIEEDAAKPSSASNDMGSVTKRPLSELIEADKYLASKAAASKAHKGLTFSKLIPPGAQ